MSVVTSAIVASDWLRLPLLTTHQCRPDSKYALTVSSRYGSAPRSGIQLSITGGARAIAACPIVRRSRSSILRRNRYRPDLLIGPFFGPLFQHEWSATSASNGSARTERIIGF